MVYESGFTTRRTYVSRPFVTSYAVSYPTVTRVSRVYKTSYPIYSTSSYTRGSRVIASPVRIITSPARVVAQVLRPTSPVRISRTTAARVVTSPERLTSYTYTKPTTYASSYIPSTYSSYAPYIPRYIPSYTPSTFVYSYSRPVTRIYSRSLTPVRVVNSPGRVTPSYLKTTLPGYGARALTNYLSTEPFTMFREETERIRNRAQSLMRDLHTPVVRRARSMTPFPVTGFEPTTDVAFDAYVSRITNPVRNIAKEVHRMSMYPEPAHKYVGKSHLASVRICGGNAYNIRRPMYDTERVRTDINLLSWYLRHPTANKEKNCEENVESVDTDPELDPYRPTRKFSAPRPLENPIDEETKEKQRLRQERLMTVNEEEVGLVELEKKKAQRAYEAKQREQKAQKEEAKCKALEAARCAEEAAILAEEDRNCQEEEMKRLAEIERQAQEVLKAAQESEKRTLEEEQKRKAMKEEQTRLEEEEARLAQEARLAEVAKMADVTRLAEEERLAEAAKTAEDAILVEEAKLAEEAASKAAEASRLAQEQRIREEEINRLAEIEKKANEEREAELARQAAELAEIARQETEIAAQELRNIKQTEEIDITANCKEVAIIEESVSYEVEPLHEPTIDFNINSDYNDNSGNSTEEETVEE